MQKVTWNSSGPDETLRLGECIGQAVCGGECIGLTGPLGAGKTQLVKGMAIGLGASQETVTSPTFTLIHEYVGRIRLIHLDLYRLKHLSELTALGFDELISPSTAVVIEWADRFQAQMPSDILWIAIEPTAQDSRRLSLTCCGQDSTRLLAAADQLRRRQSNGCHHSDCQ